ncbi:unnamed protein product [Cuscuta campestris]|uniref:Uncharacterized protein n=1 Tax=Cuscuta campestris TaxID=132261 RepID=A0A484NAG1_9ASTE|nr:unnamed protein product [Cuscuta campestris]
MAMRLLHAVAAAPSAAAPACGGLYANDGGNLGARRRQHAAETSAIFLAAVQDPAAISTATGSAAISTATGSAAIHSGFPYAPSALRRLRTDPKNPR